MYLCIMNISSRQAQLGFLISSPLEYTGKNKLAHKNKLSLTDS